MARRKTKTLTEGELDFMRVLWSDGEANPETMQASLLRYGRDLTGGTIRNVLAVMIEKGYVTRRKQGKAYLYHAAIDEEQALKHMAQNLLKTAFRGSESLMVGALLRHSDVRIEELDEIERLIAERRKEER